MRRGRAIFNKGLAGSASQLVHFPASAQMPGKILYSQPNYFCTLLYESYAQCPNNCVQICGEKNNISRRFLNFLISKESQACRSKFGGQRKAPKHQSSKQWTILMFVLPSLFPMNVLKTSLYWRIWVAQSFKHLTLDLCAGVGLKVMRSSLILGSALGIEPT